MAKRLSPHYLTTVQQVANRVKAAPWPAAQCAAPLAGGPGIALHGCSQQTGSAATAAQLP